jgi:transposase
VQDDTHQDSHQDTRKGDEGYRRIELISGTSRRRRWSDEERARILTESFAPGANISAVARRHGVSGGLLHCWRKQARALASEEAAADTPTFVPIAIADERRSQQIGATTAKSKDCPSPPERMIEIETSGALVRVPIGADSKTLSIVLAALRRAP